MNGRKEHIVKLCKKQENKFLDNKITRKYSDFYFKGDKLPFTLICTAEIVDDISVMFSLDSENETVYDIQGVCFPAPFTSMQLTVICLYGVEFVTVIHLLHLSELLTMHRFIPVTIINLYKFYMPHPNFHFFEADISLFFPFLL